MPGNAAIVVYHIQNGLNKHSTNNLTILRRIGRKTPQAAGAPHSGHRIKLECLYKTCSWDLHLFADSVALVKSHGGLTNTYYGYFVWSIT